MRKSRATNTTKKNIQSPLVGPVYVETGKVTSSNGNLAADFTFPNECIVTRVEVNGVNYIVGDYTNDCYIGWGDSSVPRACGDVAMKGDTLRWNGSVTEFQLDTKDRIDIHTKTVNTKVDVVSVPVCGHGITMKSGKAKVYSTPGLIGGSWANDAGETFFRKDNERCIPLKVIIKDYDHVNGFIEVKAKWFQEEGQADLRDYVVMRVGGTTLHGVVANGCSPLTAALNLMPQDPPSSGQAGDFFVWAYNNKLYFHDGISWNKVMMGQPAVFNDEP
jgi:hypothetical protein